MNDATKKPRDADTSGAMTHRKDVPMSNTNCTTTPANETNANPEPHPADPYHLSDAGALRRAIEGGWDGDVKAPLLYGSIGEAFAQEVADTLEIVRIAVMADPDDNAPDLANTLERVLYRLQGRAKLVGRLLPADRVGS